MAGITYADLLNYNGEMETSADGWANLLAGVEENASYFQSNAVAPTGQVWTGTAAELAAGRFENTQSGLVANASNYGSIRTELLSFNSTILNLQKQLKTEIDLISNGGVISGVTVPRGYLTVSDDGQVSRTMNTGTEDIAAVDSMVPEFQAAINSLVNQANTADTSAASALQQFFPEAEFSQQTPTTAPWTTVSSYGSLWQIAQTEYGDGSMWTKIWQANSATFAAHGVTDPNVIPVGLTLKVPPLAGMSPAGTATPMPGTTAAQFPGPQQGLSSAS
jgi:hypothetical protein